MVRKRIVKTSAEQSAAAQSLNTQASLGGGRSIEGERGAPDTPPRPARVRMNSGENLYVPEELLDRKNFAYRWFAENSMKGGRVASATGAYWTMFVDPVGNNWRRPSGLDQMHFMQLEIEYWLQDQELKKEKVRVTLSQETAIGEGEYAPTVDGRPEGGMSAIERSG